MLRYLFKKDTFLAVVAVFLVMGLLALVPVNTHILDPFRLAMADFDYNDLVYSRMGKNSSSGTDTGIVIVNIGSAGRYGIGEMIREIEPLNPKVIGVDVLFNEKKDARGDSILSAMFSGHDNVILACRIQNGSFFLDKAREKGYVNFVGEEGGVIRYFMPRFESRESSYWSFPAVVVKKADQEAFRRLEERENETEIINYIRTSGKFIVVDGNDVLNRKVDAGLISGKIVLLGYVGSGLFDVEDKHFTPFNQQFSGKALPDMNGIFIHANIIRMVLDGSYIHRTPSWLNWLIAVALLWLHMAFFIRYYIDKHIWFHLAAKIAQLISAVFFVYLGLLFYDSFNIKINMTATLAVIILAVDVLYFYEAFVVWLNRKYHFKTVFGHGAHH